MIKEEAPVALKRKPQNDIESLKQSIGAKQANKVIVTGDQDLQQVNKWWEKDDLSQDEQKWTYLEHHGVLFPPHWEPHHVQPLYNGEKKALSPLQEEMATYWA